MSEIKVKENGPDEAPWLVFCPGEEKPGVIVETMKQACVLLARHAQANQGVRFCAAPIILEMTVLEKNEP